MKAADQAQSSQSIKAEAASLLAGLVERVAARDGLALDVARARTIEWLAGQLGVSPEGLELDELPEIDLLRTIDACTPPFGLGGRQ